MFFSTNTVFINYIWQCMGQRGLCKCPFFIPTPPPLPTPGLEERLLTIWFLLFLARWICFTLMGTGVKVGRGGRGVQKMAGARDSWSARLIVLKMKYWKYFFADYSENKYFIVPLYIRWIGDERKNSTYLLDLHSIRIKIDRWAKNGTERTWLGEDRSHR